MLSCLAYGLHRLQTKMLFGRPDVSVLALWGSILALRQSPRDHGSNRKDQVDVWHRILVDSGGTPRANIGASFVRCVLLFIGVYGRCQFPVFSVFEPRQPLDILSAYAWALCKMLQPALVSALGFRASCF